MRTRKNFLSVNIENNDAMKALAHRLGNKKDKADSMAAAQTVAASVQEPLLRVIQNARTIPNWFEVQTFGSDEAPVFPLSQLFDVHQVGYFNVFSYQINGGLSTNHLQGAADLVVQVHKYQGAADLDKKWLRSQNPRLNSISTALTRLAQEVLMKQNRDSVNALFGAMANSFIDGNASNSATSNLQVYRSATAGVFQLDDFNTILTKYRRIASSWVGGTPVGINASITDLVSSPEWMAQIRGIAYQPQNTRAGHAVTNGSNYASESSIAAPESVREEIFRSAGITSIFNVDLHEYNEMGIGQAYQSIFANYFTGTYVGNAGTGSGSFNSATEQPVLALNRDWPSLFRLRQLDEVNDEWSLTADDQYSLREDKVGWYGTVQEGYIVGDNRAYLTFIF